MNKPNTLVAALLAGGLLLTACSGSRTPSTTNTVSADNAATTSDARVVGNSGGSIQATQLEAERVGTGTASGSMVTAAPNPSVTVPLGSSTSTSSATDQTSQPSSTSATNQTQSVGSTTGMNSSGMGTPTNSSSSVAASSPMTDPAGNTATGKTTGQPSPQTTTSQPSPTGTTPMGDENWSANRSNPVRQSDKMDNNGVNSDNNTGMGRTTPATMTPTQPGPPARSVDDTQRMRAAQRRAPERAAPTSPSDTVPQPQQPASTSSPTTTAPPMSVQDRERMGRDANNPAGMEQRSMIASDAPIALPMVSSQAEAIDRITTRLDEIDAALETKMSARSKSTLLRERKKLMYRLGTMKAIEVPASPNPIINSPGGVQN